MYINNGDNMYLLNCFFIYSILGYFLETFSSIIFNFKYESGFLYGPWTPLYGLGSIIIIIIYKKLKNKINNKYLEIFTLFILYTFILTFIEWIGGNLIEHLFNKVFWDYSNYKFNIGKYISLEMSLIWGLMSIIFIYQIKPKLDKIIKTLPKNFTIIISILFIIDVIITTLLKINIKLMI